MRQATRNLGGWPGRVFGHPGYIATGLVFAALVFAAPAAAQEDDPLRLKRVMLSTGGVGYFEYEARVSGDADLEVPVRLDQVDDVLKSIVVYDDRGGVGSISLPGRTPLKDSFREMPFGQTDLNSPVSLLNALRGAEVLIDGPRRLAGRLLSVTQDRIISGDGQIVETVHRVSIVAPDGIQQAILEDADRIVFEDPVLQEKVEKALAAIAGLHARDRRTLSVSARGEGMRTLRVAYVVEAPLWKASYRLTLPADPRAETASLQGWAVLENNSGEDWEDIELTVVSGNPVTFTQALYNAYYVERPSVPVEVLGRVLPQPDRGVLEEAAPSVGAAFSGLQTMAAPELTRKAGRARNDALRAMPGQAMLDSAEAMSAAAPPEPTPLAAQLMAASSDEAATQVVFRFPEPVSVASGHSLLAPFFSGSVPAERLSLYDRDTHARHPLAAVNLVNESDSGLPPGVITLYERHDDSTVAFIGDARLNPLPKGEKRLLSFAVDQKTRISRRNTQSESIVGGKLQNGLLQITRERVDTTVYEIKAPETEARRLLIEHPRRDAWTMDQPDPERADKTDRHYRLPVDLKPAESRDFEVIERRRLSESIRFSDLTADRIDYFIAARQISDEIRDALQNLAAFRAEVDRIEAEIAGVNTEIAAIEQDQQRIRNNMQPMPRNSDLFQRYLRQMNDQEDRMQDLRERKTRLEGNRRRAKADLANYAKDLTI